MLFIFILHLLTFFFSFLAQLHDLVQLKQENSYLTTIARQIGPYIRSIAKVKERLEPRLVLFCHIIRLRSSTVNIICPATSLSRLKEPKELKDDRTETMLKIYEDSSMAADTQPRQALITSNQWFFFVLYVLKKYVVHIKG